VNLRSSKKWLAVWTLQEPCAPNQLVRLWLAEKGFELRLFLETARQLRQLNCACLDTAASVALPAVSSDEPDSHSQFRGQLPSSPFLSTLLLLCCILLNILQCSICCCSIMRIRCRSHGQLSLAAATPFLRPLSPFGLLHIPYISSHQHIH